MLELMVIRPNGEVHPLCGLDTVTAASVWSFIAERHLRWPVGVVSENLFNPRAPMNLPRLLAVVARKDVPTWVKIVLGATCDKVYVRGASIQQLALAFFRFYYETRCPGYDMLAAFIHDQVSSDNDIMGLALRVENKTHWTYHISGIGKSRGFNLMTDRYDGDGYIELFDAIRAGNFG